MLRICQVGCCALVALGVQLSGGSVAWGQFEVVGREPAGGPAAVDVPAHEFCHCLGDVGSDSVARINRALAGQLLQGGLEFVDAPLEDVMNVLQEEYEIPIQLDTPALEDIGIGPDEPVTVNVRNISLRSALRLMLGRLQLTYVICNEMLMITTPDEAETELVVCVYKVGDLLDNADDNRALARLASVIQDTVATSTWAKNGGGEAVVRTLPHGLLVVSQTQAVHEEIGDLLRTLRAASGRQEAVYPRGWGGRMPGEAPGQRQRNDGRSAHGDRDQDAPRTPARPDAGDNPFE